MAKRGRPKGQMPKMEIRGKREMFEIIDKERGHEPRSAHVRRMLEMNGYIAIDKPEKNFPVIYVPHLPQRGLLEFLQDLKNSSGLHDQRLSSNLEDWKHIGYGNRPIPEGSWPMRTVTHQDLVVQKEEVHERNPSNTHSHALLPMTPKIQQDPSSKERQGLAFVDQETLFRYGRIHNLRGYVLEPLTTELYHREYRASFAIDTLLRFEDSRVWKLEEIDSTEDGQMLFTCSLLDPIQSNLNISFQ